MVEKIELNDIKEYIKYLKLKPNFSIGELKARYLKLVKVYHPKAPKGNARVFEKIIYAYELLLFFHEKTKKERVDKVIDDINQTQLVLIKEKVSAYLELSYKSFMSEVDKAPLGFKIIKYSLYLILGLPTLIMLVVYLLLAFGGELSTFGIFFIGCAVIGIVIYVLRGKSLF